MTHKEAKEIKKSQESLKMNTTVLKDKIEELKEDLKRPLPNFKLRGE